MFLVNKEKKAMINMGQVTNIYIGADGCTLKVDFVNGKGCQIGGYKSEKEAQTAMVIIAERTKKAEVCFVPQDSSVSARMNLEEQKSHHITGKKTKGHGGS